MHLSAYNVKHAGKRRMIKTERETSRRKMELSRFTLRGLGQRRIYKRSPFTVCVNRSLLANTAVHMGHEGGPSCEWHCYIVKLCDCVQNHFGSRSTVGVAALLLSFAHPRIEGRKCDQCVKMQIEQSPLLQEGMRCPTGQNPSFTTNGSKNIKIRFNVARKFQYPDMAHTSLYLDKVLVVPRR